ncbi:AAA-ATPase [Artemisia annua]|uniref:AAA-ATPase n=1 Tax=Artemisia annua TaxID=35608 RepID=A0A2U1MZ72_ARTAN|nr:AAA-ATPase [Artemisia annua]
MVMILNCRRKKREGVGGLKCEAIKIILLFEIILVISEEIDMTPADVVENLMPKTSYGDPEGCLNSLIGALKTTKLKKTDED